MPSRVHDPIRNVDVHKAISLATIQELVQRQESLPEGGVFIQPLTPAKEQAKTPQSGTNERPQSLTTDQGVTVEPLDSEDGETGACKDISERALYCTYAVESGDTLSSIAASFDLEGTPAIAAPDLIALSNDLGEAEAIVPGQELRVPMVPGVLHDVLANEVLSSLAQEYGVSLDMIATVNGIDDFDTVVTGSVLLIPEPASSPVQVVAVEPRADEAEVFEAVEPENEDEGEPEPLGGDCAEGGEACTAENDEDVAVMALALGEEVDDEVTEEPAPEPEATADENGDDLQVEVTEQPDEQEESTPTGTPPSTREAASTTSASAAPEQRQGTSPPPDVVKQQFAEGYLAAGGSEGVLQHILDKVLACESSYNVYAYNPGGPFYGLMQFLASTWRNTGGGDWTDARQQGANTATLLKSSDPRTQWPACW